MSKPTDRATYGDALAVREFRGILFGQTLDIIGGSLRIVALSVLVLQVSGSTFLSAVAFGAGFLPQAIGATLFGANADRLAPRQLITIVFAIEAVTGILLGAIHMPPLAMVGLVSIDAVLVGACSGSRGKIMVRVLSGDVYVMGRSLMTVVGGGAQLVGLGLAGGAVAALGPQHAFFVTAGCSLAAIGITYVTVAADTAADVGERRVSAVRATFAGNRALLGNQRARRMYLAEWVPAMLVAGAEGLLVSYAVRHHFGHLGPSLLLASYPLGMTLGDFTVARSFAPATRERMVPVLVILTAAPLLVFFAGPPLWVAMACVMVSGLGLSSGIGLQRFFVEAIPDANQGQAFSLLGSGMQTVQGLGAALGGALSALVSVGPAMALCGLALVPMAGWMWWVLHPQWETRDDRCEAVVGGVA